MALKLKSKEITEALKSTLDTKAKAIYGDLAFEFCNVNDDDHQADLTSAILLQSSSSSSSETNNELSFLRRYLSRDFTDKPVLFVSKIRHASVSEENEKQFVSTPASVMSSGSSLRSRMERKQDASEVWGSPLKCNFPLEDESISSLGLDSSQIPQDSRKLRLKHLGVPLDLARKLISIYNLNFASLDPLLLLCDGEDRHTTALMGVKQFQVLKEERTAKGFKLVTVTVAKKERAYLPNVKVGGGMLQTCHAVYQVNADNQKPWATVAVEIKWKGASCLLEKPPMEASTTVKASVQSGTMMKCAHFHQELQFLDRILTALTSGQMDWIPVNSDAPTMPLTASVQALVNALQEEGTLGNPAATGQEEGGGEAWSFTTAVKMFSIPERKDYDFTDRLWKVMLNCMSTSDLVTSLRLVFRALGQGHLQPFVDRHNQTTVAQIVRDCFYGRYCAPSLTGVQPLLFLAEMGAEKLRRDYIQVLVSQSLATPASLEEFASVDQDLADKLQNLGKLHSVLEMMALLGASLRLRSETLGTVARQMLSHYRQHPADPTHVFSFPVKTSEVRYVLSSLSPVVWSVETTNKVLSSESEGGVCESSLHCACTSQPFLHLHSDRIGEKKKEEEEEAKKEKEEEGGVELSPLVDDEAEKSYYYLVQRKETVMVL